MIWACSSEPTPELAESEHEVQTGPAGMSFNQGWRVDLHVRLARDLGADGRSDLIGFGDAGVTVALSQAEGGFATPSLALASFGNNQGFTPANSRRVLADVNADGKPDIVVFGPSNVQVALNNGAGGFATPVVHSSAVFAPAATWHVLTAADVSGDGRADLVGIDDWGVYVSLAQLDGTFAPRRMWFRGFSLSSGGWDVAKHLRLLVDINNDGKADIVGFGQAAIWVAHSNGEQFVFSGMGLADFGFDQGWLIGNHTRMLVNLDGDRYPDLIGLGNDGVHVALDNNTGTGWLPRTVWSTELGASAGGWDITKYPRLVGDVDGDGRDDIVGIGNTQVFVAHNNGAAFETPTPVLEGFGFETGWRVEKHPRMLGDLDGDGQISSGSATIRSSRRGSPRWCRCRRRGTIRPAPRPRSARLRRRSARGRGATPRPRAATPRTRRASRCAPRTRRAPSGRTARRRA
jgi:hypothetical protein